MLNFSTVEQLLDLSSGFDNPQDGTSGYVAVFANDRGGVATVTMPDLGAGVFVVTRISEGYASYSVCHVELNDMRDNEAAVVGQILDLLLDFGCVEVCKFKE